MERGGATKPGSPTWCFSSLRQTASRTICSRSSSEAPSRIGPRRSVSEPFCADCNRIRLTAEGKLRTCLFSITETDLRGPMREGAADDELEQIIRDAVWRKELKHHVGEPGFVAPPRSMSAIGG